jgi:hypothetical protein
VVISLGAALSAFRNSSSAAAKSPRRTAKFPRARCKCGSLRNVLSPIGEPNGNNNYFLDLDIGQTPAWPANIPLRDASDTTITKVRKWASQQGVDLIYIAQPNAAGGVTYVLSGVDLQLCEINKFDAQNINNFLAKGTLPERRKLDGNLLLHQAKDTQQLLPARDSYFLYLTRDKGMGIITITDFVTTVRNLTGTAATNTPGVGFNRGIRFDYHTIAR